MPLYLGIDTTGQGLFATLLRIDAATRTTVFERPIIHHDLRFAVDRLFFDLAMLAEHPVEELRVITLSTVDEQRTSALMPLVADRVEYGGTARLSAYWRDRYSLPAARILASPPQIPVEAIGLGVVSDTMIGVMLSAEDTILGSAGRRTFVNGASVREATYARYGVNDDAVAQLLASEAANDGALMLPWLKAEITPQVRHAGVRRFGFDEHHVALNVRSLVEGQMMAMANHAVGLTTCHIERVVAAGREATSHAMLQLMANVFGAEVQRLDATQPAALGAALHGFHDDRLTAGEPMTWRSIVSGFVNVNPGYRASPNPRLVAMYAEMRQNYALLERLHQERRPIC